MRETTVAEVAAAALELRPAVPPLPGAQDFFVKFLLTNDEIEAWLDGHEPTRVTAAIGDKPARLLFWSAFAPAPDVKLHVAALWPKDPS